MKVVSVPVEGTNPFADAAGTSGSPLEGELGAVGQISMEWNKAVEAVVAQDTDVSPKDASGVQMEPLGIQAPKLTPIPPLTEMEAGEPQPMGAQWDRLSMTVASLVAWNLTNEVAPDAIEDLAAMTAPPSAEGPTVQAPDPVAVTSKPETIPLVEAVDTALAMQSASVRASEAPREQAPVTQFNDKAQMSRAETISNRIAGQTGTFVHVDNTFREGKNLAPDGVRTVPTSTESEPFTASAAEMARAGTMDGAVAHTSTYGPKARLDPEIPTSLAAAAAQVDKPVPNPLSSTTVSHTGAPLAENQGGGYASNAGAPVEIPLAQKPASTPVQAAELSRDPSVSGGATSRVAEIQKTIVQNKGSDVTPKSAPQHAAAPEPTADLSGKTFDASTVRRRAATGNIRSSVQTPNPNISAPEAPQVDGKSGQSSSPFASTPLEPTAEPQRQFGKLGPQTSLRMDAVSTSDMAMSQGGTAEPVAVPSGTGPISDMERDFSMTESVMDAETIGAEEVPELPLADSTHFDIDIDDPGGKVRLDLTRQAGEVAIRLETPEEILEEYRNLEDDIEEALEEAGLSLADYEAATDSDQEERSDRDLRERTSSGSQDRENGAEETPKRGRLLNRIV